MEDIPIDCAPGCDYTLTVESFSGYRDSRFTRNLVLSHVAKGRTSYENAKACMSRQGQGVHSLYRHLTTYEWVSATTNPKNHSAYRSFNWYLLSNDDCPIFHYPHFFVIQALFPESDAVKSMYSDLECHCGVRLDFTQSFYPRLDENPEEERKLIMGLTLNEGDPFNFSVPSKLLGLSKSRPSYYPGLSTGQNFVDTSEPSNTLPTTGNQVASKSSSNNVLRNYKEQLSSIQSDFNKRLSDFQSCLELQGNIAED
ncbi:hypothetical protein FLAG1_02759 [Fusarium langsethiae]|uniref:Uncharacterized protein n=1 Tax=Fusarium langsethiae TaxID=179993 RepID=A0A0M9F1K8_FUSLA|nr:hypothetical protein FLAG1_02759 [Fusarium langsethiae]GKU02302.1 unnamed protein product [Fusarium langsethiae]GKU19025.1 unnamed protein product [Fusarium langsethiae]